MICTNNKYKLFSECKSQCFHCRQKEKALTLTPGGELLKWPGQMVIMGVGGQCKSKWFNELWKSAMPNVLAVDIEHEPKKVIGWDSENNTPQQIPNVWLKDALNKEAFDKEELIPIKLSISTSRFQTKYPNKSNIPKEWIDWADATQGAEDTRKKLIDIPMMAVDIGLEQDFTVEANYRKDKDGNIILIDASIVPKKTKECASKYCNNPVESLIGFCRECEKEEMR